MSRPEKLNDAAVKEALAAHPLWKRDGKELVRTVDARTFAGAVALVCMVADRATWMDHHPDIAIRGQKVTFRLTTHDANGITALDVRLAAAIDGLATA
jgi:4a-hydroxytetrahydrobiopterin dehydratase